MALINEDSFKEGFVGFAVALVLGMPVIGWVGSLIFGPLTFISAITKTDSWLNALHAIGGFLGYWAAVGIFVVTKSDLSSSDLPAMMVLMSIYSFVWILWMRKTTEFTLTD